VYNVHKRTNYEADAAAFAADAYAVDTMPGVAWRVFGWETQPDEDTEWSGIEQRTGNALAVMVGDDCRWSIEPDRLRPLAELEYCHVCGQIGCTHDGYIRETSPAYVAGEARS